MPTCKSCDTKFPNRYLIDGKFHNLCSRKYCLECSPFGKRNTKKLHLAPSGSNFIPVEFLSCLHCGKSYVYSKNNSKGHTKNRCNSCAVHSRRHAIKQRCIDYKGGACERCGYNSCNKALCFHHLDPNEKVFSISGSHCFSWSRIKAELDKCIMVCANCHIELHAEQGS